ncbi:MAG TPA: hypothetical protein VG795_14850 [Acidimicrobiia bacterium]|nr:hypothetical protein [Acidimicrobiia bacterium]
MTGQAITGASSRADRRNRIGLTVVGLVLAGLGGYGLARGWGAFGEQAASEPLLADAWRRFVGGNQALFWAGAAMASLLIALVGLRWLRAQLAESTPRRIDLTHRGDGGTTVIVPAGAAQALAGDVERYGGVASASARLTGDQEAPEVDLRIDVADSCNVPALLARIEGDALERFRRALEFETVDVNIEFRLTTPTRQRVR